MWAIFLRAVERQIKTKNDEVKCWVVMMCLLSYYNEQVHLFAGKNQVDDSFATWTFFFTKFFSVEHFEK